MAIKKYSVTVSTTVEVEIDDAKLTEEFQEQFNKNLFPLDGLDGHAKHLAVLHAREAIGWGGVVEGYGTLKDRGVSLTTSDVDVDLVPLAD